MNVFLDDFELGSVKILKVWTTSRGLPSIPYAAIESAWKEQAISLKTGVRSNRDVIAKARAVIRRMYEKYGSSVRVDEEIDERSTPVAITFRVVELCSCP